jgi:hypothetical protein
VHVGVGRTTLPYLIIMAESMLNCDIRIERREIHIPYQAVIMPFPNH